MKFKYKHTLILQGLNYLSNRLNNHFSSHWIPRILPPFKKMEYELATNYLKNEVLFSRYKEEIKIVLNDTFIQEAKIRLDGDSPSKMAFLLRIA
ncbi:MAG: hypothetical protein IPQ02_07245 [Saprospiraceae bacterium]|nr:hypothetical protein [Candidatus Defluviibacterium haderslevense]